MTWVVVRMAVLGLVALALAPAQALAVDDYPADCAPVVGENCRTAPLDAYIDHWGFYSRECTSFVAWRLSRRGPFHNTMRGGRFGNANTWAANAQRIGFPVDDNPAPGSVAWSGAGDLGHVAIVESVNANGTVTIEEYNRSFTGTYSRRTVPRSSFRYIHIYDSPSIGEGSFVAGPDGAVYRIAGGAPIYVSTWSIYGGPQPVTHVSAAQLNAMRPWPADGTLVNSAQDGAVYRIAGGAPIYVSTWNTYGGPKPTITIDKWAIDHPGHPLAHLRPVPVDGTFINAAQDGAVYRIAGGAPIYVSTWSTYGGPQPTTSVDKWAIDNLGHPAAHMRRVPADGTFVLSAQNGAVYRIAGGAPIYVSTWSAFGGVQPHTVIDKWAIDHTDHPASHLRPTVADRTFVRVANGATAGHVARAAGGALFGLSTCEALGGCPGYVNVDEGGFAAYLRAHPRAADGTTLRGLPSGTVWEIREGVRHPGAAGPATVDVNDSTIGAIPLPAAAPAGAAQSVEPPAPPVAQAPAARAPRATLSIGRAISRKRLRAGLRIVVGGVKARSRIKATLRAKTVRRAKARADAYGRARLRFRPVHGTRKGARITLAIAFTAPDGSKAMTTRRIGIK